MDLHHCGRERVSVVAEHTPRGVEGEGKCAGRHPVPLALSEGAEFRLGLGFFATLFFL